MHELTLFEYCYRNLKPGANLTIDPSTQGGSSDDQATSSGSQGDSKLELFGFDSLVNILGLRRYDQSFYSLTDVRQNFIFVSFY